MDSLCFGPSIYLQVFVAISLILGDGLYNLIKIIVVTVREICNSRTKQSKLPVFNELRGMQSFDTGLLFLASYSLYLFPFIQLSLEYLKMIFRNCSTVRFITLYELNELVNAIIELLKKHACACFVSLCS